MGKKPELLIAAGNVQEVRTYIEAGASAVLVGEEKYGLRLPGSMSLEQIEEAARISREKGAKLYAAVNHIIDNGLIQDLSDYLIKLDSIGIDAVVFGDPAVLMLVKQLQLNFSLFWNAEMTATNYSTANYWASKGASRAIVARELNMDEIIEFKQHAELDIQIQVHGMTNIYHSKRSLLMHYFDHQGRQLVMQDHEADDKGMYLMEEERPHERFPIYQDANGTHIMSSNDICLLECLDELLAENIDSLYIEGLLKPVTYNEAVLRTYRAAIEVYCESPDDYVFREEWLEQIQDIQDPHRELSFGFLFKMQVY